MHLNAIGNGCFYTERILGNKSGQIMNGMPSLAKGASSNFRVTIGIVKIPNQKN